MSGPGAPFRGLAPFTESDEDSERFVGRDEETRLIAANLLAARLTVLYGPAGVGKSSLLRAGVVHRLRQDVAGAVRVAIVYVSDWSDRPGQAILDAVAAEATRLGDDAQPPAPDLPLDVALEAWADRLHVRLLLVLDQFEEYCLYHPPDADALDRELPLAIERDDVDVRVLISLREDALALLDRYKGRVGALFGNRFHLDNLTAEKGREAIRRPVERYNEHASEPVSLEPGFEETVVAAIAPGSVALATRGRGTRVAPQERIETAYLQLVMTAVWDRQLGAGSRTLRTATLRAMGGVTGIVRGHVDATVDSLSERDQAVAASVLHFLVTPSGTKIAHTAVDLASYAGVDEARVTAVLDRLGGGEARVLRRLPALSEHDVARFEVFHDVLAPAILDWRARFAARRQSRRTAALMTLVFALVVALAGAALQVADPGWIHRAEAGTADARASVGAPVPGADDFVVAAFDDPSLRRLGQEWPVDRRVHARVIDALRRGGAKAIAYDIEFRNAGKDPAVDAALQAAIARAGPQVVLAGYTFGEDNGLSLFDLTGAGETTRLIRSMRTRIAYTGIPLGADGVYRSVESSVRYPGDRSPTIPTFAVAAARVAGAKVPDWEGSVPIEFGGGQGTLRTIPVTDVLSGRADVSGKIVVVGAPAGDTHLTPASSHPMMGAEIQANAIATARARHRTPGRDVILIALLALAPCAFVRARTAVAAAGLVAIGAAYLVAAQLLWDAGHVIPVAVPIAALALSAAGLFAIRRRLPRRASRQPSAQNAGGTTASAPPPAKVPTART